MKIINSLENKSVEEVFDVETIKKKNFYECNIFIKAACIIFEADLDPEGKKYAKHFSLYFKKLSEHLKNMG